VCAFADLDHKHRTKLGSGLQSRLHSGRGVGVCLRDQLDLCAGNVRAVTGNCWSEPYIIQYYEVSHGIVMIETTSRIGDWVVVNTVGAGIEYLSSLPIRVSTPKRFIKRIGNVIFWIEWPS